MSIRRDPRRHVLLVPDIGVSGCGRSLDPVEGHQLTNDVGAQSCCAWRAPCRRRFRASSSLGSLAAVCAEPWHGSVDQRSHPRQSTLGLSDAAQPDRAHTLEVAPKGVEVFGVDVIPHP